MFIMHLILHALKLLIIQRLRPPIIIFLETLPWISALRHSLNRLQIYRQATETTVHRGYPAKRALSAMRKPFWQDTIDMILKMLPQGIYLYQGWPVKLHIFSFHIAYVLSCASFNQIDIVINA